MAERSKDVSTLLEILEHKRAGRRALRSRGVVSTLLEILVCSSTTS